MRVRLEQAPEGAPNFCFGLYDTETGKCVEFIQVDWDYAPLARRFGWTACTCGATDGTIPCPHRKVGEMLADAYDYLVDHSGEEIEWDEE